MRYEARITAYDMLDQVHVSCVLSATDDLPGHLSEPVAHWTATVPGTGELSPSQWTNDALVALLEVL